MYNVDLHTHSQASPDGGISLAQYKRMLASGVLDAVAITDHNSVDFALVAQQQLGDQIIIGEEIMTSEGEIIGLFLQKRVAPDMTPEQTVQAIKDQGGIVYIPHPFETLRKGISQQTLDRIARNVDMVEVYNGRAMQPRHRAQAVAWAQDNNCVGAASSDAHGAAGWGKAYTTVKLRPTPGSITKEFRNALLVCKDVGMIGRLYPTFHRLKSKSKRHA